MRQIAVVLLAINGLLAAPVSVRDEGVQGLQEDVDATSAANDTLQQEIDEIIKQGFLENTENLDKINASFTLQPGEVKLCVRLSYIVRCKDNSSCLYCHFPDSYYKLVWTSMNPSSLSGSFLLEFARLNWEFFGFQWQKACDISTESTITMNITAPTLKMICGSRKYENGRYLFQSLKTLTEQVGATLHFRIIIVTASRASKILILRSRLEKFTIRSYIFA